MYFWCYFITVLLLLRDVSVPKTIRNMCFPMVAIHRLRTAVLDQQAEKVTVTANTGLLSEKG